MTRAKGSAFLLGLASFSGLLLAITFAVIPAPFKPPPPLGLLSPASLGVLLFLFMAPVALLPGCIALSLWLVVVRAQEEKERRWSEERPAREAAFQAHLDNAAKARLAGPLLPPARLAAGGWDEAQQRRLQLFEAGIGGAESLATPLPTQRKSTLLPDWITRWLVLVLFISGSFLILWGVGVFITFLWTEVPRYFGF